MINILHRDGRTYRGDIVDIHGEDILFLTGKGLMIIKQADVCEVTPAF